MAEVLSQTEIDALLAAVSSGSLDTEEGAGKGPNLNSSKDWIAYDLTSQEKIVRGRLAALQGIHERFSRMFRATLSNTLKKKVTVNCTNTDFIRFGDYLQNILLPTSLNIVHMSNLKGHMIFVVSSKLTYAMVDAYYGGSERPFSKIGGREEFTTIESNMVKRICTLAVSDLKEAWRLNYPVELEYLRSESNPSFVGAIHTSETVAVVTFEVEFENVSGPFVVIIQVRALDPVQQYLSVNVIDEIASDAPLWKKHWLEEIGSLELDVRVELGNAQRSLTEVNAFKAGQEICLMQDAAEPIQVFIDGIPKLKGLMGVCRGNSAVRVTDFVAIPPNQDSQGE